jgi:CheY-like chemotaxis protein
MDRQPSVESLLIVDHHPNDITLLREALAASNINTPVYTLADGAEFLKYLQGEGPYADRSRHPIPQIALIEWDLPERNALQVLQLIRENSAYSMLPIMIWTRVDVSDADLKQAYSLGLSGFFAKPNSPDISSIISLVFEYWKLAEKPSAKQR